MQEDFRTQEGFAKRRTRALTCISDDVGKTEMSPNIRPLRVGRSAYIPVRRHQMARKIIVDEAHNSVYLPRSGNPRFFRNRPREGILLGGISSGQRLGRNGCGWQSGDVQERTARPSGRIHEGSLLACNTQPNAEHEELIDVYSTRVGWRSSSRPNRLYSGLTRLVPPRHTAGISTPTAKRTTART